MKFLGSFFVFGGVMMLALFVYLLVTPAEAQHVRYGALARGLVIGLALVGSGVMLFRTRPPARTLPTGERVTWIDQQFLTTRVPTLVLMGLFLSLPTWVAAGIGALFGTRPEARQRARTVFLAVSAYLVVLILVTAVSILSQLPAVASNPAADVPAGPKFEPVRPIPYVPPPQRQTPAVRSAAVAPQAHGAAQPVTEPVDPSANVGQEPEPALFVRVPPSFPDASNPAMQRSRRRPEPTPLTLPSAAETAAQLRRIEAAWQPASGRVLDLLPALTGGVTDTDGLLLDRDHCRAQTTRQFRPPVTFRIVALTQTNDTRLAYAARQIIFNWEMEPTQLRIDGGPANGRHAKGAGLLPAGQWVGIELKFTETDLRIFVDGHETYRTTADFSRIDQPLAITAHVGSTRVRTVTAVTN